MSTLSSKLMSFLQIVYPIALVAVAVFLVLHPTGYYHALNLMKSDLKLFVLLMIYPLTFHLLKNRNLWRFLRNLKKILKIILIFTYCASFLTEVQYLKYQILIWRNIFKLLSTVVDFMYNMIILILYYYEVDVLCYDNYQLHYNYNVINNRIYI